MGTNDPTWKISTTQTLANLRWMIDRWRAAGRRADHFLLTTLAPRTDSRGGSFPALNDGIRTLAKSQGVVLIDLANHTSADNGLTWRSSSLHVGDGVHYSEPVRDWIATQIVAEMRTRVP
jgi:lysophospholipase L1-like esterase